MQIPDRIDARAAVHRSMRPTASGIDGSKATTIVAALLLVACAGPQGETRDPGGTKKTALEVCRPQGERAYLSRLACADGAVPTYRRIGSFGFRNEKVNGGPDIVADAFAPLPPGVVDWHIVDGYELSCGATKRTVFLDMYHCQQPPPIAAPTGFVLTSTRP